MSFNIWNNLDEIALYLGLERIDSETNEAFYNRIKQFGRWKYRTDYYTQVHSIPIQSGLETKNIVKIYSNLQYGSKKTYKCNIDWEYFTLSNDEEGIRVFIGEIGCKLSKVLNAIDNSKTFSYKLYDESYRDISCKFIIRNSNIKTIDEFVDSTRFRLAKRNIVEDSLKATSNIRLYNIKDKPLDIKHNGDYFIDHEIGYLEFAQDSFDSGYIKYKYYDDSFYIEYTDINLIPISLYAKNGITNKIVDLSPYILNNRVFGK